MGDDKVKESPSEVFATVADVNSAIHSMDDVFGVRFEAVEEKLAAMDIKNESRFEAVNYAIRGTSKKNSIRWTSRTKARFQAVDVRFQGRSKRNSRRWTSISKGGSRPSMKNSRQWTGKNEKRNSRLSMRNYRPSRKKMAATDVNYERRFATLGTEIAELNARVEGGFDLLVEKINAQDLKVARSVTSAANKQLIMMLVIAGSIIASLLYVG